MTEWRFNHASRDTVSPGLSRAEATLRADSVATISFIPSHGECTCRVIPFAAWAELPGVLVSR